MTRIIASPTPLIAPRHHHGLVRADRDPLLMRVRPGVYTPATAWHQLAPWERYLARVHAVGLTWAEPVFCLESAAALLGMPLFGEPCFVHVLGDGGMGTRKGDVAIHVPADGRRVHAASGLRMATLEETTVDLCRVLPPAFALAVADWARRAGAVHDLAEHGRAQQNRRGLRRLAWVQARATPVTESPGESVSRAVIEWLGFEPPELQVVFHFDAHEDRTDFFWRRLRIVGESDGYGKYDATDAAATRSRLVAEKRREDRLRRHLGGFARWDWADAMQARPLERALRAAGLAPQHPAQPALLATLRRNARSLPAAPRIGPSAPKLPAARGVLSQDILDVRVSGHSGQF